jgi:putative transposase
MALTTRPVGDKPKYLPRLHPTAYQSDAVVHWTLTTFDRGAGWLTQSFHLEFRELMLHAQTRERLVCPIYVLMPDHIHFVWMGLEKESDQKKAIPFLRTYLEPLMAPGRFQPQAHDRVLRTEDRKRNAFARVCDYVRLNPFRANLVAEGGRWDYMGSIVPGYPKLNPAEDQFWERFWKIYFSLRNPECGQHVVVSGMAG